MIIQHQQYGLSSTQQFKLKRSIVRPHSQQRISSSSLSHHYPPPLMQRKVTSPNNKMQKHIYQGIISNQYYVQARDGNSAEKSKHIRLGGNNASKMVNDQALTLDKMRTSLIAYIQKEMGRLNEEIKFQSISIMELQSRLHQQGKQIETKNSIIKGLIFKVQQYQEKIIDKSVQDSQNARKSVSTHSNVASQHHFPHLHKDKESNFNSKRVDDLQIKLRVMISHLEEEKVNSNKKIERVSCGILKHFGKEVTGIKQKLASILIKKITSVDNIELQMKKIEEILNCKVDPLSKLLEKIKIQVKLLEEQSSVIKETCSQLNNSKDTATHISSYASTINPMKSDLFLSDYFFHPAEADNANIKVIQQLVKERQQLPIRVYLDSFGRLKYFQTRTFLFDRKGNFTTPAIGQLNQMEKKGWIKVVSQ